MKPAFARPLASTYNLVPSKEYRVMTISRTIPLIALVSALFIFGGSSSIAARITVSCPAEHTQCVAACETKNNMNAQARCIKRCTKKYCPTRL